MKPRINYISIATNDLLTSFIFYRDGLGLSTKGIKTIPEQHACFKLGNGLDLVLYDKNNPSGPRSLHTSTKEPSNFIISHRADSKEEVDTILQKALGAGARQIGQAKEEPWWYAVKFADPDGHQWDIVWEA